ncbi:MAG: histidine kinase [Bifidobacterium sp.]|jgi:signal transduction histidine kinase|nr:histidine kinase [Bifidobacterium sp.]MCI1225345.1 histidine kinase [Bifidobacterium sp.]
MSNIAGARPSHSVPPGSATGGAGGDPVDTGKEVPVATKIWCTIVMVPAAGFMCLAQTAFAASAVPSGSPGFYWFIVSTLVAFLAGFVLVARAQYPEPIFWVSCVLVAIFPFDSLIVLMALTSLLARRTLRRTTFRAVAAATAVTLYSQLRDVFRPAGNSMWHAFFADPQTGEGHDRPLAMLTSESVIIITAVVVALCMVVISVLSGLHIRSRAELRAASARVHMARAHAGDLQTTLDNRQLADAIAVEAHDTLAHSLSLIAANANVLQVQSNELAADSISDNAGELAADIKERASQIRQQAAKALGEAHSVIDKLRNPEQAWAALAPTNETSLTQESLDGIISEAREAGMQINSWIDVRQLSQIDDAMGKIAYRAVQEGLTNAQRHAPGNPVSLQVSASPDSGIHVHVSNPMRLIDGHTADEAVTTHRRGTGIAGLAARARACAGTCHYGVDDHKVFHLDLMLPAQARIPA